MTTRHFSTRFIGGLAAATAVVAALAGCSDASTPATPAATPGGAPAATSTASNPAPANHNAADATFVQGMIPHHRQAIAMSDLAGSRAASPEVKDLAGRISAAQGPEIDQMNQMLTAWGMAPGMSTMPGMEAGSMGGMGGMGGMMSPEQMRGLEVQSGSGFDRAFLRMMIEHHTGAIQMARTELAQGQNPEAKKLAHAIADAQQSEILQMQSILARV